MSNHKVTTGCTCTLHTICVNCVIQVQPMALPSNLLFGLNFRKQCNCGLDDFNIPHLESCPKYEA